MSMWIFLVVSATVGSLAGVLLSAALNKPRRATRQIGEHAMNFDPEKLEPGPLGLSHWPALEQWLLGEIESRTFLGGAMQVKRWQRVFWLVACNGSWQIGGWGAIRGGHPFPRGLDQNEAIELISFEAFFQGASAVAGINLFDLLLPAFKKFVEDVEAQAKALAEETPQKGA